MCDDVIYEQLNSITLEDICHQSEIDQYPLNQILDICYCHHLFDAISFLLKLMYDSNIVDTYCLIDYINSSDYDSVKILLERFEFNSGAIEDAIEVAIENDDRKILDLVLSKQLV